MLYCLDDPSTNFAEMTLAARFAPEGGAVRPAQAAIFLHNFFRQCISRKTKAKLARGYLFLAAQAASFDKLRTCFR